MAKLRVGVLASGRGTNLQAIIDAIGRGEVEAEIVLIISNRPGALALQRAVCHNIPAAVVRQRDYPSRLDHQIAIAELLKRNGIGLVVLAGFDRILLPEFVRQFPYKVINIHPSLLPAFAGGLHAQAEALSYGVKLTGCTVHFTTEEVDAGPIILQAAVPVLDDDTVESLSLRILQQEHKLLPQAIDLIAKGGLNVSGRRVVLTKQLRGE
ncbi:MAG: phosphoribosylglycinamide formyltransferase [Dehalococcoidia bacterium]|nr:phosphoribosylglycinamide formyltransferase [Dehalococcoidia bacterium]